MENALMHVVRLGWVLPSDNGFSMTKALVR